MSIISDALKKVQKERNGSGEPPVKGPVGTQGTSFRWPVTVPRMDSSMYAYAAAAVTALIITVLLFAVFFASSSAPDKGAGTETKASVPASRPSAKQVESAAAIKIEPFAIPIPRISSQPAASIRTKSLPELNGIMYLPTSPQAVVNGRTVKEGDTVDGYTVNQILPDRVKLSSENGELELELR